MSDEGRRSLPGDRGYMGGEPPSPSPAVPTGSAPSAHVTAMPSNLDTRRMSQAELTARKSAAFASLEDNLATTAFNAQPSIATMDGYRVLPKSLADSAAESLLHRALAPASSAERGLHCASTPVVTGQPEAGRTLKLKELGDLTGWLACEWPPQARRAQPAQLELAQVAATHPPLQLSNKAFPVQPLQAASASPSSYALCSLSTDAPPTSQQHTPLFSGHASPNPTQHTPSRRKHIVRLKATSETARHRSVSSRQLFDSKVLAAKRMREQLARRFRLPVPSSMHTSTMQTAHAASTASGAAVALAAAAVGGSLESAAALEDGGGYQAAVGHGVPAGAGTPWPCRANCSLPGSMGVHASATAVAARGPQVLQRDTLGHVSSVGQVHGSVPVDGLGHDSALRQAADCACSHPQGGQGHGDDPAPDRVALATPSEPVQNAGVAEGQEYWQWCGHGAGPFGRGCISTMAPEPPRRDSMLTVAPGPEAAWVALALPAQAPPDAGSAPTFISVIATAPAPEDKRLSAEDRWTARRMGMHDGGLACGGEQELAEVERLAQLHRDVHCRAEASAAILLDHAFSSCAARRPQCSVETLAMAHHVGCAVLRVAGGGHSTAQLYRARAGASLAGRSSTCTDVSISRCGAAGDGRDADTEALPVGESRQTMPDDSEVAQALTSTVKLSP
jgi:hypothetical protein